MNGLFQELLVENTDRLGDFEIFIKYNNFFFFSAESLTRYSAIRIKINKSTNKTTIMKTILIFLICLLIINTATAQCNGNIKIISAASPKPTEPVVSITCSTFTVKWKGQTNQSFVITVIEKTKAYRTSDTIRTTKYSFDGSYYSTTINLQQGKIIYWAIEAITVINNTNYYSYALRGVEGVPNCLQNAIAHNTKKDNSLTVITNINKLVKIYPNPFQSLLNIEFVSKSNLNASINIYDANGKLFLTKSAQGNTQLDLKQLTAGTYLIKINDEDSKILYSGKVIKQ